MHKHKPQQMPGKNEKRNNKIQRALEEMRKSWKEKSALSLEGKGDFYSTRRIKRVVYSGGGAKGVTYPGGYEALVESGVHSKVKEMSGASVGAITAAFISCGMTPEALRELFLNTRFNDLLGKRVRDKKSGVCFLTKDGNKLLELLRNKISESMRIFLDNHQEEVAESESLRKLYAKVKNPNPIITFADQNLLNQKWPAQFKRLTVIAVTHGTGEPQIFKYETTPQVEIALACRASASLPIILEPVLISFNDGVRGDKLFVDGGVFDNLPTDYFDFDEATKKFMTNQQKDQTLVFAFGNKGADYQKTQLFQAQFGNRMDEIISDDILQNVLDGALKLIDISLEEEDPGDVHALFKHAITASLKKFVHSVEPADKVLYVNVAETIRVAAERCIGDYIDTLKKNPELQQTFLEYPSAQKIKILETIVRKKITPVLYQGGAVEALKRNKLLAVLGDMKTPYKNTEQVEKGYHKLRSEYPLRTVELRVGNITTTDFNTATKHARVLNNMGYLDTINHIINHDLHDRNFRPAEFFKETVSNFEKIYEAVIKGAEIKNDKLIVQIRKLKARLREQGIIEEEAINREEFYCIKQFVEKNLGSTAAFALSRAVEFRSEEINAEQLFKETYQEAFRRSGFISLSKITGTTVHSNKSLQKILADKNMFDLFESGKEQNEASRSRVVFDSLKNLASFNGQYQDFSAVRLKNSGPQ